MALFSGLLIKLIALYLVILLGFIAGKFLKVQQSSVSSMLIYIITPVVVFDGILKLELNPGLLSLPFFFLILCSVIAFLFLFIAKFFWKDATKNILAFSAGTANAGYFGVPVAIILFGEEILGIAVLAILGFVLFQNTIGFMIIAGGKHSIGESFIRALKLPTIYAAIAAVVLNYLKVDLSIILGSVPEKFLGTYSILGMMMVGLGLSKLEHIKFNFKFMSLAFLAKFVVCPLLVFAFIFIDKNLLHIYSSESYKIMLLMSMVPLAANAISYTEEVGLNTDSVSMTVLMSTLFALFYIPAMSYFIF